jgi:hypothetical protein
MTLTTEAKKLDDQFFEAAGMTPRQIQLIYWATKLIMVAFVVFASFYFWQFYEKFNDMGCEAYCETKIIGQGEQRQYGMTDNPEPTQTAAPNSSFYQNSGSNSASLP